MAQEHNSQRAIDLEIAHVVFIWRSYFLVALSIPVRAAVRIGLGIASF
jgi:hypothetical protein